MALCEHDRAIRSANAERLPVDRIVAGPRSCRITASMTTRLWQMPLPYCGASQHARTSSLACGRVARAVRRRSRQLPGADPGPAIATAISRRRRSFLVQTRAAFPVTTSRRSRPALMAVASCRCGRLLQRSSRPSGAAFAAASSCRPRRLLQRQSRADPWRFSQRLSCGQDRERVFSSFCKFFAAVAERFNVSPDGERS